MEWRHRKAVYEVENGSSFLGKPYEPNAVIEADCLDKLADVVQQHGDCMLRATQQQNLVLRWVQGSELIALHAKLNELGLAGHEPAVLRNLATCTGAATCRLGICLSHGLALAIRDALCEANLDLAIAREAARQGRPWEATVLAARSLLVTRGQQAHDASDALEPQRISKSLRKL